MTRKVREALVSAANSAIGEFGTAALSVEEVAARAGVDLATFHSHFSGREDIVDAVARDVLAALVDYIDDLSASMDDPAESTSVAARVLVGLGTSDPELARALLHRGDLAQQFDELITPGAERVFRTGVTAGRFCIADKELAVRMALSSTLTALQAVTSGATDRDAGIEVASWLLRALGVPAVEAAEIARRPLPPLPLLRWSATSAAPASIDDDQQPAPSAEAPLRAREPIPDDEVLLQHRSRGVLHLELNRAEALNALSFRLGRELRDALRDAAEDETVRCVLISGAGRAFCSGWDIRTPGEAKAGESVVPDIVNPIIETIRSMPKPVIAMVHGVAAGIGCSLALAADLVVAGRSSTFLLAFARIGLSGDGGVTALLPARIGLGRAARMMMLAESMGAADAAAAGLVDELVDDDQLEETARSLAVRLASGPTRSYAATKQLLTAAALPVLPDQLVREQKIAELLVTSRDYGEGRRAFAEKRPPEFTGH